MDSIDELKDHPELVSAYDLIEYLYEHPKHIGEVMVHIYDSNVTEFKFVLCVKGVFCGME